ncbi:MFS transporter [Acinetobacter baumannii]|uniref:MFS transporter n=1 Tax=Acinetobacter baumannii TaxID=470 RepID=UPI00389244F3
MQDSYTKELINEPTENNISLVNDHDILLKKVMAKLLPVLFIAYFFSYLDRVNIGFAKLQMQSALGFSEAQYALAASVLYIGYALFEVPSNILMEKIGARKTLSRIMILWGLASAATMLVSSTTSFYVIRFLLGVFEAGFFPCLILYLSYWFPSYYRAKVISILLLATLAAPMLGAPISSLIMTNFDGALGLGGWQWMFLLEGLPIVFIGVFCFFFLTDNSAKAKWLTESEKKLHAEIILKDNLENNVQPKSKKYLLQLFTDINVYALAFLSFSTYCGVMAFNFWLPTFIKELGVSNINHIGFYSVIPFAMAGIGVFYIGKRSDKKRERKWHYVISMIIASISIVIVSLNMFELWGTLILLGIALAGFYGGLAISWTLPASYLEKSISAPGIALISTLATTSGIFAPILIGFVREHTGSSSLALMSIAGVAVAACLVMLFVIPKKALIVSENISKS